MRNSYICISSSDPRKEMRINDICSKLCNNPIKYGPNYELLIPWTSWCYCHFELFFDYSSNGGRFYIGEDISIGEYILETEEIIEVFDNNFLNGLAMLESRDPKFPLFSLFGNLISSNHNKTNTIKFLISDFKYTFSIFTIPINLDTSCISYEQICSSYEIDNELEDILLRRVINSNPKRFEFLNNVINKK